MKHTSDPYTHSEENISEPPLRFVSRLRYLGPGLILSASIVGSGELIATTKFGSEAGFVCLWVILVSCLVKVALQLEFGRHTISTGQTNMESLDRLPGPRLGKTNWAVWTWLGLMPFKFLQVGGILGAVALASEIAVPGISADVWVIFWAIAVSLLVFSGRYSLIEKTSIILISLFTILIFFALGKIISLGAADPLSESTAVSLSNIAYGLNFNPALLKGAILGVAIGAFGITGVGGDEIMHYNYWLLEKGYASRTGPRPEGAADPAWTKRARGWIRIMYIDALLSMVVYTVMTVAFYLLGASILRANGGLGEGQDLIPTLAKMFTDTFGDGAKGVFLVGAFVVLFSTLLATLAALSRTFADCFSRLGFFDFRDPGQRGSVIAKLSFIIPMIWAGAYYLFREPAAMVIMGGIATSVMLLIVVIAGIHFHRRTIPKELAPGKFYRLCFWLSVIAILSLSFMAVGKAYQKYSAKSSTARAELIIKTTNNIM